MTARGKNEGVVILILDDAIQQKNIVFNEAYL